MFLYLWISQLTCSLASPLPLPSTLNSSKPSNSTSNNNTSHSLPISKLKSLSYIKWLILGMGSCWQAPLQHLSLPSSSLLLKPSLIITITRPILSIYRTNKKYSNKYNKLKMILITTKNSTQSTGTISPTGSPLASKTITSNS